MKYVSKKEFLEYPKGTVYAEEDYPDCVKIKESNNFGSIHLALDVEYENIIYTDDDFIADYFETDMFYVYEEEDIKKLKEIIRGLNV